MFEFVQSMSVHFFPDTVYFQRLPLRFIQKSNTSEFIKRRSCSSNNVIASRWRQTKNDKLFVM